MDFQKQMGGHSHNQLKELRDCLSSHVHLGHLRNSTENLAITTQQVASLISMVSKTITAQRQQPPKKVHPDQETLLAKLKDIKKAIVKLRVHYGTTEVSLWEFPQHFE